MIINNGILLYIDPGTGSMLFTILLGVVGTGTFFIKKIWLKLKLIVKRMFFTKKMSRLIAVTIMNVFE